MATLYFRMKAALVLALLSAGCVPHVRTNSLPDECPGPNNQWTRFGDQWRSLLGTYRLITVTTSLGGPPFIERGTLKLMLADSATRFYRRAPMNPHSALGDRPVVGTFTPEPPLPGGKSDSAEYENGRLYIGCRRCLDGDPLVYDIGWSGATGFGGMWRDYQSGIVRAIDDRGRPTPDPAGHFCAVRSSN